MKWWGDNIKQTLKLFVFNVKTVSPRTNFDLNLKQFHDLRAGCVRLSRMLKVVAMKESNQRVNLLRCLRQLCNVDEYLID